MSTDDDIGFGLVHGGFHGGWCWDEVIARLPGPAVAPDLPGRSGTPQELGRIRYEDWVEAATIAIAALPARRIVLAAHSLGGITLPQVAARLADRVAHIVFVASVLPPEGEAFVGLDYIDGATPAAWPRPPAEQLALSLCNDMEPGAIHHLLRRLTTAEPMGPLLQPITRRNMPRAPVTFVRAEQDVTGCLADLDGAGSRLLKEFPQARVVRIDAGHNLIMTAPTAVAQVLREAAAQS